MRSLATVEVMPTWASRAETRMLRQAGRVLVQLAERPEWVWVLPASDEAMERLVERVRVEAG